MFQWSRLSDHIGRKPVLLIALLGTTLSMLAFGLSHLLGACCQVTFFWKLK